MKKPEELFDTAANRFMIEWDLDRFKRTHARLYSAIIQSIQDAINQANS